MLIDVKSISRFCTICVVLGGLVFSSPALSQTGINDGIDPRVIEIVDLIERRISEGNIEFQNQASSAALTRLESICLLYTSPSPRDLSTSRMPSSA